MANKKNQQNAIEMFLLNASAEVAKTSIMARKIDSKDKAKDAKRFYQQNTKKVNLQTVFVENFKTALFNDVSSLINRKVAKDTLHKIFIENTTFDVLPSIVKLHANMCKKHKVEVTFADFLKNLKTCLVAYFNFGKVARENALAKMSDSAKTVFNPKEEAEVIALVAKALKPKAKGARA